MMPAWLALVAQAGGGGGGGGGSPIPFVSSAVVNSHNAGACDESGGVATPAQIRISWAVGNPDDTNYQTVVLENGVQIAVLPTSTTLWDKTINGNVETNALLGFNAWSADWTYTIKIQRKHDSVFTSSTDSAAWTHRYDTCS